MTDPWYGTGQGVGDACLCWVIQGNSLILAYESKAMAWIIHSPKYQNYHKQVSDAFIDNTNLINGQQSRQMFAKLIQIKQHNSALLAWPTTSQWRHTQPFQMCMAMLLLEVYTQQYCNNHTATSSTTPSNSHNPTTGATTNIPASAKWTPLLSWYTPNNQQKLQNGIGNVQEMQPNLH